MHPFVARNHGGIPFSGVCPKYIHENNLKFIRAVLMGTKSCTKIFTFSIRFSCENLADEDFVTLVMGKKSC